MSVKIGGADGGGYVKKKTFKIKDGDNVFRILPSLGFGGKEPNGRAFQFWNVHFGYKNAEGKARPFQSPEVKNRETKMIEKADAAKQRIETLKSGLEKAKEAKDKATYDVLAPLVSGQKPMYNLDNNHHCNAINATGEIGVLKLRHRAKLVLDAVIKTLRAKGIEPLGADNGRFFVINRTGTGLETTFTVTVLKRSVTIDGQDFEQDVVHKLTPEIIARLEAEAGDLSNLYKKPSSEEVALIVKNTDLKTGKCAIIDDVLKGNTDAEVSDDGSEGEEEPTTTQAAAAAPTTTAQPAAQVTTPAATTTSAPTTQSLSQPAPAANVKVGVTEAPKPAENYAEMSDDDFLKSLGA
jgi:hypothetical protein